ncbi:MAG TPA: UDP-2,3-diacylglucosamine diphosphatase [Chromatiales bacterium]|nr:UDP-2,3-diacylglucosamine diphosphatase [Chromatiales bacterium]HEX22856.1 UDP-2,3-diacylglucosamine diphosphatase [Chromatiales bacterium]
MSTLFISDLHLSAERPHLIKQFVALMQGEARKAEALYILGDLFEAWLGDDAVLPDMTAPIEALKALTESGVPVYVMAGNRDFLMGEGFEAMTGAKLIDDPVVIDLYGTPTLLMHGDTLCTDDVTYQQVRARVRDPAWIAAALAMSIEERIKTAQEMRAQSQAHTQSTAEEIMDVNADAVMEALHRHGVTRLIHGHTHRPAVHILQVNGQPATRIVLDDWYQQASLLRCDRAGCKLIAG